MIKKLGNQPYAPKLEGKEKEKKKKGWNRYYDEVSLSYGSTGVT
jgi:hypothetical protein